jgi:serine phosphatase RsbU (regulator of sigma subunit)/putative methionine-R-sulfoxide reductase with GAF domain
LVQLSAELQTALYHASLRLNASLDARRVTNGILEECFAATSAERGLLTAFDSGGHLVPQAAIHLEYERMARADLEALLVIAQRAVGDGQPILESDPAARSSLCVPLQTRQACIGAVYLDRSKESGAFEPIHRAFLVAFAPLAAQALHNARLYETAARSVIELRRLYDTSLDLTSQLEIDHLLDLIIHRAADLLHGDSGNFYLYEASTDTLVPCAPYGQHAIDPVAILKPGEGATGQVFMTGEPLVIEDYDEWEGRLARIPRGRYARVLHAPVKRGPQVLGVVSVNRPRSAPPFGDEDMRLLMLFANQAAIALENARLYQLSIEKASLERELQVAHQVQSSLIPREIPEVNGWTFAVHWQPAREVSGDFYDFIPFPNGQWALVVGDVTGKGVPAALMMATTRALLRGAVRPLSSPGKVLESVNNLLQPDMPPKTFVTVLYGILDPLTGQLRYANAGHDLPYQRTGRGVRQLRATGVPLGLMPGIQYQDQESYIAPGDLLLLCSDGLVEAHNPNREMFGQPRIAEIASQASTGPILIRSLLSELAAFAGVNWEQEDDITLVSIQRNPPTGQHSG